MRHRLLRLWGGLPFPNRLRWWMVLAGTPKFPISVTAVITDDAGRLLMFRHTYRGRYPWGLPSGWLKPREKPETAVIREIREETGLEAAGPRLLLAVGYEDARRLDLVYRAALRPGAITPRPMSSPPLIPKRRASTSG